MRRICMWILGLKGSYNDCYCCILLVSFPTEMSANRRDKISTRMEFPWTVVYCVFLVMCERLGTIFLFLFFLGLRWTCYFFNGGVSASLLRACWGECLFVWQVNTKCNIWHVLFVVPHSRNYNGNFQSQRGGGRYSHKFQIGVCRPRS